LQRLSLSFLTPFLLKTFFNFLYTESVTPTTDKLARFSGVSGNYFCDKGHTTYTHEWSDLWITSGKCGAHHMRHAVFRLDFWGFV
jgi:hypothetical protein